MKKHAFSLVELMVTLIIVSVIAAAMAPAITKKLSSKEITVASVNTQITEETCPAGYYCPDNGTKIMCPSGTCNNSSGAKDSSACVACSTLIANCSTCDIISCGCLACNSGYSLSEGSCKRQDFAYEYTGTAIKTTFDNYTRIILTTSGTFTAKSTVNALVFVLGGGGGGGGANFKGQTGSVGCSGNHLESEVTLVNNEPIDVTIGLGGEGGKKACIWQEQGNSGSKGAATTFGSLSALGGGGGNGYGLSGSCTGGAPVTFAQNTYADRLAATGVNTGVGGTGGKLTCGYSYDGGESTCGCAGTSGYSGVVVIKIPF